MNENKLVMRQSNLIKKLEENFKEELLNTIAYKTPARANEKITHITNKDNKISPEKQTKYNSGVGMLFYLIKFSRKDISNSV